MQGKVLVIDAIATNRIVLKVKLSSAYYDVVQANSLAAAEAALKDNQFDLIIMAMALPDGDIKQLADKLPTLCHALPPPIMAITNEASDTARSTAIRAGARGVILRPLDELLLLSQVRALIRTHTLHSELETQNSTVPALTIAEPASETPNQSRVSVVTDNNAEAHGFMHRLRLALRCHLTLDNMTDVLGEATRDQAPDAFVLLMPKDPDASGRALQLISALRANLECRHAVIVVLAGDPVLASNALDMGADDVIFDIQDSSELPLRLARLLAAKHRADHVRKQVRRGLRAAAHDSLTGLFNRRYAMPQLDRILADAKRNGTRFALMLADMDHFKQINDTHGHMAGDAVLIETGRRLKTALRCADLLARIGGEEFLIALPQSTAGQARKVARRMCDMIGQTPFEIPGSAAPLEATISIGLTIGGENPFETSEQLIDRADKALYSAKTCGRNQVTLGRSAA